MFRKVLFPTDGSEHSIKAARYLVEMKQLFPAMEITQLFVQPVDPVLYYLGERTIIEKEDRSADVLRPTNNLFHEAGILVQTLILKGRPAEQILEMEDQYDLVIMGARGMMQEGRGYLQDLKVWLGSVSRRVLHKTHKPVIITKCRTGNLQKFLLATDGSKYSVKAAAYLRDMIRHLPGAQVTIFHSSYVVPIYNDTFISLPVDMLPSVLAESAEKVVASAREVFVQAGIPCSVKIASGPPATEICREVKREEYDMVVMGSHGYGTIDRIILGSVSERVAEDCESPVLIVR